MKDIGKINIALNPVFEIEREDDEWEAKVEYAAGVSYEINRHNRVGLEVKGSKDGHYVGPTISHGAKDLWAALGSGFGYAGVEEGKAEFQIRMLLGIGFH